MTHYHMVFHLLVDDIEAEKLKPRGERFHSENAQIFPYKFEFY